MEARSLEEDDSVTLSGIGVGDDTREEDISEDESGDPSPSLIYDSGQEEADERELEESSKETIKVSHDTKLRELLRNLCLPEVRIYSEASKEFVSLLKSDSGGELLRQYVKASPSCTELMDAWKLREGKAGLAYILSLISTILDHPDGKYCTNDVGRLATSKRLDTLARSVIEIKLEDVYTELNSKEPKRQRAALHLMASVVRRGVGLASEVAKHFDFKLPGFPKLAGIPPKKGGKKTRNETRPSFIEFAISFLEVGNPRLLRWILQQKDMYFGVLRGIANDEDTTVSYILSTLRDKVLNPAYLVPPGLQSVLFGSVTLEQLGMISGNANRVGAAELAHEVLVMVCTDPCHGLMPDFRTQSNPLKGNQKRLLEFMKKLKPTESGYHKDLLLAIANGRPYLCSAYMDDFPYVLEPRPSLLWFSSISLAADLISAAKTDLLLSSLTSQLRDPRPIDSSIIQCLLTCILPRSFTRLVMNRGLLHSDALVKYGSLRILLESLKSLNSLINAINSVVENVTLKDSTGTIDVGLQGANAIPKMGSVGSFRKCAVYESGNSKHMDPKLKKWVVLKQEIQDEVRVLLPDPQVLFKLLLSFCKTGCCKTEESLKRPRTYEGLTGIHVRDCAKKLKPNSADETLDLVISGLDAESNADEPLAGIHGENTENDERMVIAAIWGLPNFSLIGDALEDTEVYFYSKLLEVLTLYLKTVPNAFEGSFDFFKILPNNPLLMPIELQKSLMSLLVEYTGQSAGSQVSYKASEMMYKHLQSLINLLILSPVKEIQQQARLLVHAAMMSTGAFDQNISEVEVWLSFFPVYGVTESILGSEVAKVVCGLSDIVVTFFCDAISTVGNNLFKYLVQVQGLLSEVELKDVSPNFSPLVLCILQKCLRLLESASDAFKLSERCMISTYVSNSVAFLLQSLMEARSVAALIHVILGKKFELLCLGDDNPQTFLCEWKPLKHLLVLSRHILQQQNCVQYSESGIKSSGSHSLLEVLQKVEYMRGNGFDVCSSEVATAFSSAVLCSSPNELLANFPKFISVAYYIFGANFSFFLSLFYLEWNFLDNISEQWLDMFVSGIEMVGACSSFYQNKTSNEDIDSLDSAAVAFSVFLRNAPYTALVPSIICLANSKRVGFNRITSFCQAKLSSCPSNELILLLRILLFWAYQLQSSYKSEPSVELEVRLTACLDLIEQIFDRTKAVGASLVELSQIIFRHPAITVPLSQPFCRNVDLSTEKLEDCLEMYLYSSKQIIHAIGHHILQLLQNVGNDFSSVCNALNVGQSADLGIYYSAAMALWNLVNDSILEFKKQFHVYLLSGDLMPVLPRFHICRALLWFMHPCELLELVDWMFHVLNQIEQNVWTTSRHLVLSMGFLLGGGAFDMLGIYLHRKNAQSFTWDLFWRKGGRMIKFDFKLIERVYTQIVELATFLGQEYANQCLLLALSTVHRPKSMPVQSDHLPLSMFLRRMVTHTSIKILPYLIKNTSKTKRKILFRLIDVSPLHLSLFGKILFSLMNIDMLHKGEFFGENFDIAISDEDSMLLLPAALAFVKYSLLRYGKQHIKHFLIIPLHYARILLNGFRKWKSYVSQAIFWEEVGENIPETSEEILQTFESSLLGKGIHMLEHYIALKPNSLKKTERLSIFDSMYQCSSVHEELLDVNLGQIDLTSSGQSLNLIYKAMGKIAISRMMLLSQDNKLHFLATGTDECTKEVALGKKSCRVNSAKLRFAKLLIGAWDQIVRKFPLVQDGFENSSGKCGFKLFRFLELFLLRNILDILKDIQTDLIKCQDVPFLEPFVRSCLIHRFEDPLTLRALRGILVLLSEGERFSGKVLELLLAHSQFVPTILWSGSICDTSALSNTVTLVRPMSSILKPTICPTGRTKEDGIVIHNMLSQRKFELVKLLRVLFHLIGSRQEIHSNSRELISLLLSGYGATLDEIDLEIYDLIYEIEPAVALGQGSLAEMDYLWGFSASKVRKEEAVEKFIFNDTGDGEATKDCRKRRFRENLPIDSRLCTATVQNFCYDRSLSRRVTSITALQSENLLDAPVASCPCKETSQKYDPAFIMCFSIHGLSMGYLEPVEFVGLGLLAVAFISMSSPDEEIRKLGYEVLGRFKQALEHSQAGKERTRLRLLLTYLQNGISEPWQKIPSIIAMFAAEASLVLLNPAHDLHVTIIKFLMRSPKVDLKNIPLFHTLFGSSSVNFKADRSWILRLSYAGLNMDDDGQIFMRKSLLELLLGFYMSSLSDDESKNLILLIVKKSIKMYMVTRYLVERCGLLLWLSSVLTFCDGKLSGDQGSFYVKQMVMVLEAVKDVLSMRSITEWLRNDALEQLTELSSQLQVLFFSRMEILKENLDLVHSILDILVSALRISQKRKIYQPHFTLSMEGLLQLYEAMVDTFSDKSTDYTAELSLNVMLMSMPPTLNHLDNARLSKFTLWLVSVVLRSNPTGKRPDSNLIILSEEQQSQDSLTSKVLRWMTASVILGKILEKPIKKLVVFPTGNSKNENLQFLLEIIGREDAKSRKNDHNVNEALAVVILYLLQLLGTNCDFLPSVICALCLLLYDVFKSKGQDYFNTLCSKIRCPPEASPAWRWSYYQPWKDLSSELTDLQRIEELQACQSLLIMISDALQENPRDFALRRCRKTEISAFHQWERDLVLNRSSIDG